ncbi:MAG: FkbM family methyltransferase [Beijerinckiaceae bacterium]|nr:FkbM family methyltransferase [Beijerinckiaceae bacterium]
MTGSPDSLNEIHRLLSQMLARQSVLESRIEQLLLETEFVRRHMSHYLGAGRALTYLDDETPIYVNSNDFGPPSNLLNGGIYEQDNLDVILSFLRHDSVFLDIGANVGFFSLKVGARLRSQGVVHAFEPHPELSTLLRGSAHLNGLGGLDGSGRPIQVHAFALGDKNETGIFSFPQGHMGGGTRVYSERDTTVNAQVRRLDDLFPSDFKFDVAKVDVERHELAVLEGMRTCIQRSENAVVVFEKHGTNCGYEGGIETLFNELGFAIYWIGPWAQLSPVDNGSLNAFSGDFVAARPATMNGELDRRFFHLHHSQLVYPASPHPQDEPSAPRDDRPVIVFHGPYWHLRKGVYRVTITGDLAGALEVTLASRFGYAYSQLQFSPSVSSCTVVVERDLINFECVGRARPGSGVRVESFKFQRIG